MAAVTARSAEGWRATAAAFGTPDWDTGTLAHARVVDADTDNDPARRAEAAAAAGGDPGAARRLGEAGVVAIGHRGELFELEEDADGWTLLPAAGTPDVDDLAMAAAIRAGQVAAQRRGLDWR